MKSENKRDIYVKTSLPGRIASSITAVLIVVAAVGFGLRVYQKVSSGHGLDTYFTGWGVQMSYIGVFIVLLLIPIVLLVGWIINYFITKDERQLKKTIEQQSKTIKNEKQR
jgi:O-antigen/teichoic acid export membrane protein